MSHQFGRIRAAFVLMAVSLCSQTALGREGPKQVIPKTQPSPTPQPIKSLLKEKVFRSVTQDREIVTSADLERIEKGKEGQKDLKKYKIYAVMLAHASTQRTREVLTDYPLYEQMISYVDKSHYDPKTQLLDLEGGIWKFKMQSILHMQDRGPNWIHYRVVSGHFRGMEGDIFFEPYGENGTLVYLKGDAVGRNWPPAFIMERGAEIVFGFTAKNMRSMIESQKPRSTPKGGEKNDRSQSAESKTEGSVPTPRGRL